MLLDLSKSLNYLYTLSWQIMSKNFALFLLDVVDSGEEILAVLDEIEAVEDTAL